MLECTELAENNSLAPVVLFCFCRVNETKIAIQKLQANYLASQTILYVFSDGPRNINEKVEVDSVRNYLKTVSGFKNVVVVESPTNKGLAKSVLEGVSKVIAKHQKVIVVEDDLVTSPNFLDFMNQALNFYSDANSILSISGYTLDLPSLAEKEKNGVDAYLAYRASSWGWGTWSDRWFNVDWSMSDYLIYKNSKKFRNRFMKGGSDMLRMLSNQNNGKIDSWAIRFCFHQAKNFQFTIFPTLSKVVSIGFDKRATHTVSGRRFRTPLDLGVKRVFKFEQIDEIDPKLAVEFRRKFSVLSRIIDKLIVKFRIT